MFLSRMRKKYRKIFVRLFRNYFYKKEVIKGFDFNPLILILWFRKIHLDKRPNQWWKWKKISVFERLWTIPFLSISVSVTWCLWALHTTKTKCTKKDGIGKKSWFVEIFSVFTLWIYMISFSSKISLSVEVKLCTHIFTKNKSSPILIFSSLSSSFSVLY